MAVAESAHVAIAPLRPELYADAVRLWRDSGLTRPWNDPEQDLTRAVDGPASTVLAAVRADHLLGTAMVGHDGHRGWVYYLAVRQAERSQGLGRALLAACERWLCERGVPKVQLMVRNTNRDVLAFYDRLGYTDADVVVLGRRLAPLAVPDTRRSDPVTDPATDRAGRTGPEERQDAP